LKLHDELAGIIASVLCFLVLYTLGWVTLIDGGISLPSRRGSPSFIGGNFGIVVGASFFLFCFAFTTLLVKMLRWPRQAIVIFALLLFAPPLAFHFLK
jgi:hypothetical protein